MEELVLADLEVRFMEGRPGELAGVARGSPDEATLRAVLELGACFALWAFSSWFVTKMRLSRLRLARNSFDTVMPAAVAVSNSSSKSMSSNCSGV